MKCRSLTAVAVALVAACTIEVPLDDKRCPCADDWICNPFTDTCERPTCDADVTTSNLSAQWSTSNEIFWTWDVAGQPSAFLSYELVLAESKDDLETRSGTARTFDVSTNSELGDPTTSVVTRGLDPDTTYFAQLVVTDSSQCSFGSDIVARATRAEAQNSVVIFRDEPVAGGVLRPEDAGGPQVVSDGTGAHIEYVPRFHDACVPEDEDFDSVRALCGQPIKLQEMTLDVSRDEASPQLDRLNADTFGESFLEMSLSSEAPVDTLVFQIWFRLASCTTDDCRYVAGGFTLPANSGYEPIQIPLTEFRTADDVALTYEVLDVPDGEPIKEFGFSFQWHKTGTYRIDDIVIRH